MEAAFLPACLPIHWRRSRGGLTACSERPALEQNTLIIIIIIIIIIDSSINSFM